MSSAVGRESDSASVGAEGGGRVAPIAGGQSGERLRAGVVSKKMRIANLIDRQDHQTFVIRGLDGERWRLIGRGDHRRSALGRSPLQDRSCGRDNFKGTYSAFRKTP